MENVRKETMSFFRHERGFTLIEILIVVFIISLILAIAIPNYTRSTSRAQEELCYSTQKMTEAALSLYMLDEKKQNLSELNGDLQILVDKGYLRELPQCPSGGKYNIQSAENGEPVVTCDKHGHYKTQETNEQNGKKSDNSEIQ